MKKTSSLFSGISYPVMARASKTFDSSTATIVLVSWSVALLVMAMALFTVNSVVKEQKNLALAQSVVPVIPEKTQRPVDRRDLEAFVKPLSRLFPGVSFTATPKPSLSITATTADLYLPWFTSLGYVDALGPDYRWSIADFCVGPNCGTNYLMQIQLQADVYGFSVPAPVN